MCLTFQFSDDVLFRPVTSSPSDQAMAQCNASSVANGGSSNEGSRNLAGSTCDGEQGDEDGEEAEEEQGQSSEADDGLDEEPGDDGVGVDGFQGEGQTMFNEEEAAYYEWQNLEV